MSATDAWHIAQYNIARLKEPLDAPLLADFVADLDRVNGLGDAADGFVWRHQTAEGNSTAIRVRGDDMMIINFTVWRDIEALYAYTFTGGHLEVYRKRRKWFAHLDYPFSVLWWVPASHLPDVDEANARLDALIADGPTPRAFTFKRRFPAPE